MRSIITLALVLLCLSGLAQPVVYQGNASQITGFRGGLLMDSSLNVPSLKTIGTDSTGYDSSSRGRAYRVTKSMVQRWAAQNSNNSFQQVLNNGSTLSQDNIINHLGYDLTVRGDKYIVKTDSAEYYGVITIQDKPIRYLSQFPVTDRDVPDWGTVKDYSSQRIIDTTITITVTSLTDSRFANGVKYIISPTGIVYNSSWFTLVGTTITFLNNLKFYSGQKISIQL